MKISQSRRTYLAAITILGMAMIFVVLAKYRTGSIAFTAQEQTKHAAQERKLGKLPLAAYSTSLPTDSAERVLRTARNGRYDNRHTETFDETDGVARGSISEWYLYLPALPTAESDAVVLEKVVDAKGYLSNDRTGAYSEFTISIKEIFKDSRRSITTSSSVVAESEGATVKRPNGSLIDYQIAYQGMPQVGRSKRSRCPFGRIG